jgi:hypothetical protein
MIDAVRSCSSHVTSPDFVRNALQGEACRVRRPGTVGSVGMRRPVEQPQSPIVRLTFTSSLNLHPAQVSPPQSSAIEFNRCVNCNVV